jgi:hypothetical protein
LPAREGEKEYYRCFGCGAWGDEYNLLRGLRDLVKLPEAMGNFGDHQALVARYREDYDWDGMADLAVPLEGRSSFSVDGRQPLSQRPTRQTHELTLHAVYEQLTDIQRHHFVCAALLALKHKVPVADLADYVLQWHNFERDSREMEELQAKAEREEAVRRIMARTRQRDLTHRNGRHP